MQELTKFEIDASHIVINQIIWPEAGKRLLCCGNMMLQHGSCDCVQRAKQSICQRSWSPTSSRVSQMACCCCCSGVLQAAASASQDAAEVPRPVHGFVRGE